MCLQRGATRIVTFMWVFGLQM